MKTSFQEIYDIFIGKITDYQFLSLPEEDINEFCSRYLKSAITKFKKSKVNLYDRNEVLGIFNNPLEDVEKEILAMLMIVEWLTPQVYNIMNTKQFLGDQDYKFYSQANHLKEIMELRNNMSDECNAMITYYTWEENGLEDLK